MERICWYSFTGLYALGVNALVVTDKGEKASMQVSDIVKRKSPEDMPQGTVGVENPALHLTAAYLAQEMRRPAAAADKERMAELNEELTADFKKGTFIFALQKEEKGNPVSKIKRRTAVSACIYGYFGIPEIQP